MDATRRTLGLSWGTVSYLDWNPLRAIDQDKPAVLLLHGGGVDNASLSWGELGPVLADAGYRVLAPDHPGYGQSPAAPWPHSQQRLVDYVGELVDGLHLDRYAIGGLSLGGGMTIGHVLTRPEGVTGAILLGSYGLMDRQFEGPLKRPAQLMTWAMIRSGMLSALMRAYGKDRRLMNSSFRGLIRDPGRRTPALLDEIMTAAGRKDAFVPFEQWQRDQFGWNHLKTNYTAELSRFPRPVLMVHGVLDAGVPIARARAAAWQVPEVELVEVPDAGHWVQRDRPEIVFPAVLEFLTGLS